MITTAAALKIVIFRGITCAIELFVRLLLFTSFSFGQFRRFSNMKNPILKISQSKSKKPDKIPKILYK